MAAVMTLEALAQHAVQGDGAALSAVCRHVTSPVYRLCLRMLGDPRDAEDATQDVLVKVVTNLASFEGRSALTTWVHQIAVRHVLAMKASRAEARAVGLDDFGELLEQGLAWGATAPPPNPEDRVLEKEVRLSCTQGMLLALSRDERLALVLVELLGFDAAEAAEIVEVSHDALRQRLSRGRVRLEAFVAQKCGVVNEHARCQCVKQLPAKQAAGLTVQRQRFSPLTVPSDDEGEVKRASTELRLVGQLFRRDGPLFAPRAVRERLAALLPTVLR
jgi:RNA polymerase sigma factor (sigma-70 family)